MCAFFGKDLDRLNTGWLPIVWILLMVWNQIVENKLGQIFINNLTTIEKPGENTVR